MAIRQLHVEGGFLDGLNLKFGPGLNVLIGERGTGKTSVVELLRYGLGAGSLVDGADARLVERARAALGDGVVHLVVAAPTGELTVSRSHRDDVPVHHGPLPTITVVGQGEMEAVGLEPRSRLRLLDRYRTSQLDADARYALAALAESRSLTEQLAQVRKDLTRVAQALEPLNSVPEELSAAEVAQQDGIQSVDAATDEAERLATLQSQVESLRKSSGQLQEAEQVLDENRQLIQGALAKWRKSPIEELQDPPDDAREALASMSRALEALRTADGEGRRASELLSSLRAAQHASLVELDEATKELRQRLDTLKAGLSAAVRAVEGLREKAGSRAALLEREEQLKNELQTLAATRRSKYRVVDEIREKRREYRRSVAAELSEQYGPHIRVLVDGGADRSEFTERIIAALTGSGLHYNILAPLLAESMSPLELVEAAEQLDEDAVAVAAGIPDSRAAQVVMQMTTADLAQIAISPVDDAVRLELLDGADYKPMADLSIGQRCTVVLPVILGAPSDTLVLDQPEDNLDNAYLATTIVPGIRSRSSASQMIVATHNPNIPVLGEAQRVFHLGSDGTRGFLMESGALDSPPVRTAITEIMEGGLAAFEKRAQFYGAEQR